MADLAVDLVRRLGELGVQVSSVDVGPDGLGLGLHRPHAARPVPATPGAADPEDRPRSYRERLERRNRAGGDR